MIIFILVLKYIYHCFVLMFVFYDYIETNLRKSTQSTKTTCLYTYLCTLYSLHKSHLNFRINVQR